LESGINLKELNGEFGFHLLDMLKLNSSQKIKY